MNIQTIIEKKRDKKELNNEEIKYFVKEYVNGNIQDYHAAALVMAIYLNGMTDKETTILTLEMAKSGEILDLSKIRGTVVDKHSTGGVGDKITLILMPIIASLGIPVAKMSGRGLGFTGGTIDKLESIPGFKTDVAMKKFIANVQNIGISLIGQTANLAPADKKLYALRDAIGCVESMPLIASSVMSKKIAAGAEKIVLDVTVGNGAFMKTEEDAIKLANIMKNIGNLANRETVCVLTNMEEPVGYAVGNSLEVKEAVEALKGNMQEDVKEIVLTIGSYIVKLAGIGNNIEENKSMILENISNGKAYKKFLELVVNQGGDITFIEDLEKFEKAKYILPIISDKSGFVKVLEAERIGRESVALGAGRIRKEDSIDKSVGFILNKKIGSKVERGCILGYVHANDEEKGKLAIEEVKKAYEIVEEKVDMPKYILEII